MVENGGQPGCSVVTIIALVARGDVIQRFSGSLSAVVATYTTSGYGRVIHKSDNAPVCCDMTIRTSTRCHYMIGRFR